MASSAAGEDAATEVLAMVRAAISRGDLGAYLDEHPELVSHDLTRALVLESDRLVEAGNRRGAQACLLLLVEAFTRLGEPVEVAMARLRLLEVRAKDLASTAERIGVQREILAVPLAFPASHADRVVVQARLVVAEIGLDHLVQNRSGESGAQLVEVLRHLADASEAMARAHVSDRRQEQLALLAELSGRSWLAAATMRWAADDLAQARRALYRLGTAAERVIPQDVVDTIYPDRRLAARITGCLLQLMNPVALRQLTTVTD